MLKMARYCKREITVSYSGIDWRVTTGLYLPSFSGYPRFFRVIY